MKITNVETFVISDRRAFVKVSTDEGIAGWGEPVLENWARPAVAAVERMTPHLLGEDPRQTTRLWQVLARGGFYRGGPVLASAVSGLDQALWDIKGKWHGVPVSDLLGGPCRDQVRMYAHANATGPNRDPASVKEVVDAGYTLIKVAPAGPQGFITTPEDLAQVVTELSELRSAIGPSVDFAVDFHGRFSVPQSRRLLPRLEELVPAFVEEPLRPEHSELIGELVRASRIPIATGERLYSRYEFRPVFEAGIAIAQPDLSHAGGITECFRIATAAEVYDVQIAPHSPLGPVALAACLQVDVAVPNFFAQEQSINFHRADARDRAFLKNPDVLRPINGYVPRLAGPGLGIEVDEDSVRRAAVSGALDEASPVWSYPDGSFAEW
jgi:galactonate dehydratase